MMKSLTPNLIVEDVAATTDYYVDVLGFEFALGVAEGTEDAVFERTNQPRGFAMLKCGGVELMLQSAGSLAVDLPSARTGPMQTDSVALYIDVEDVDALRERLGESVEIAVDLRDTFYGAREFWIRDHDGFLVGFARRPQQG